MIKVQFINLGRNKINETVIVENTKKLHKEIGEHILSKGWGMELTNVPNEYIITSGWANVGTVLILEE